MKKDALDVIARVLTILVRNQVDHAIYAVLAGKSFRIKNAYPEQIQQIVFGVNTFGASKLYSNWLKQKLLPSTRSLKHLTGISYCHYNHTSN